MTPKEPQDRDAVALVTGAGSGIGRAIALGLAADGFRVLLSGRRADALEDVRRTIVDGGGRASVRTADFARRDVADALAAWATDEAPVLDVLVHNAALGGPSPLSDPNLATFDRLLEVDLVAPLRLTRALLPRLARNGAGRVIFVSSVLARFGVPDQHAYSAAKAGLVGLARALARDLARDGIAVNAVLPGWTRTEMAEASWTRLGAALGGDAAAGEKAAMADVPLGRPLEPAEIASLVRHLASRGAVGMTGQALVVDGGVCA